MILIQCRKLRYSPSNQRVLDDVSLTIEEGQRIGLVGTNGSGKTTLLRIMNGEFEPDAGEVIYRKDLVIGAVSQFLPEPLADRSVIAAVMERGCARYEAEALLQQLGLAHAHFEQRAGDLSGGEVNRLLLARAVAIEPDIILLDEPTNHLDIETVMVFQRFMLEHLRRTFVLVSHDRSLLDTLTDRTLFVRDGVIRAFDLPYSRARHELMQHEAAAASLHQVQQERINRVEQSMKRLAYWGRVYDNEKFSRRARNLEKRVERMRSAQQPVPWTDRRTLKLGGEQPRSRRLLEVAHLDVDRPDGATLFHIDALHVSRGDRVALLGANGCGKSTLLGTLRREFESADTPAIRFNPQVRLGYYDQDLHQLDPERSLLATVQKACDASISRLRSALVSAGFPAQEHQRQVASLSGGEKSRLLFLVLELSTPNFVLLDEPTNHLDVEGCEALEEQLLDGGLTTVFVSHDRRFVENVANRYVLIREGGLEELNSLGQYFDDAGEPQAARGRRRARSSTPARSQPTSDEEKMARIIELETLLENDLARKKKKQSPHLQARWREEIAALYEALE